MASESRKRSHGEDDTSSDDDIGPALPNASVRPKKKRKLPYESLYLAALPSSSRYFRSLMHRDQLSFTTVTPHTDFLITASIDGVVKFWKKGKEGEGVEFVKEFRAHTEGQQSGQDGSGGVKSVACSADGRSYATSGPAGAATGAVSGQQQGSICIWDVVNFDLITMLPLSKPAGALSWVHKKGASTPLLAVAEEGSSTIRVFDGTGARLEPIHTYKDIHRKPVIAMAYNHLYDCIVSADDGGMLEYWSPGPTPEKPSNVFEFKSATNLFEFKKAKSVPTSITISPSGSQFATFSLPDRQIRVFDFPSGKLYRSYDESIATLTAMQQAGTAIEKLDELDFGRRMATELSLASPAVANKISIIFDESSNFILYGSMLGVKVINTLTNRCVRVYGKDEPFRALSLALYQGQPSKKSVVTAQMAASSNPLLAEAESRDPLLVATGAAKVRFYIFTNDNGADKSSRDIHNEKPRNTGKDGATTAQKKAESGTAAVLHTTYGDIHVRLFPDAAPKAVENFVTLARRGYYNGTIFHRVIKKFMIQGGDPLGDGTGGESIWGKEFEDEFNKNLRHDKPYTLSMANAGPNTNGSQFFITTAKTPWLDDKHTVFGRAVQGLDVVHRIENARTEKKGEKPEEDIKIVNIEVT